MKKISTIILFVFSLAACKDFVELDTPKTQIVTASVFADEAGARAALAGIYAKMMANTSFASGGANGVTAIAGLSSDELNNHSSSQSQIALFNNSLTPVNTVPSLWNDLYTSIYNANSILEGVDRSSTLSKAIKDQVAGEALFVRAFSYFYLINFFGDAPLLKSTDYRINRLASRTPIAEVYSQIESDLVTAQTLLLEDYSFSQGEKVNPNKWAATALLARVYLHQERWASAETEATSIIESGHFSLPHDLNAVFLANSEEAIWQLMPTVPDFNTYDGPYFVIISNPTRVSLTPALMDVFENGDNRAASWVGSYTTDTETFNYPYKYKIYERGIPLSEYQMVFRLAEQYLIRAEARSMQDDLIGAIDDVNVTRVRAGLDLIDAAGLQRSDVLEIISQERRAELFAEWGHRWFDLKRTGRIDEVLGAVKPDWQPKDAVFPIPQSEINTNPNLIQNPL